MKPSRLNGIAWWLVATMICWTTVCASAWADSQHPLKVEWSGLPSGLELAHVSLHNGTVFSSSIVLVRGSPETFSMRAVRANQFGWKRASVKALCKAAGALACVNANFFDEQGRPLGLVMSRGIIHNKIHQGGGTLTGVLYATDRETHVAHRSAFSYAGVVEAIQAGPRLLAEGAPVEGLKESSPTANLSGACIDKNRKVVIFRVTSGMFGGSFRQLQKTLLNPEIGCVEALNFDGGGSSQLFVSGYAEQGIPDEELAGEDEIPVILGLFQNANSLKVRPETQPQPPPNHNDTSTR